MADKQRLPIPKEMSAKSSDRAQAAKVGLGTLLVGAIVWLTGGFSRENFAEWLRSIAIAMAIAFAIRWAFVEPFKIPSGSMKPTLRAGDRIFVNKWVYGLRFPFNRMRIPFTRQRIMYANRRIFRGVAPQRWDIVVFRSVEAEPEHEILVKRIVGLPGERIHIEGGKVYVNGEPLVLPADMPPIEYWAAGFYGVRQTNEYALVPDGCYLLLGDNSAHSRDGRYFGWVPNENILGRVTCIAWPVSRWRDFTGFSRTWQWRTLVSGLGLLAIIRLFFGRSWRVRNEALGGLLTKGDHIFVNRAAFGLPVPLTSRRLFKGRSPRRGEIVLYRPPSGSGVPSCRGHDSRPDYLLGLVAGLPGERVYLDGWRLTVNGKSITTPPSLGRAPFASRNDAGPYGRSKNREYSLVPEGAYFLLCKQEDEAPDSRTLGWIAEGNLVGPVSAVWWPFHRARRLRP